MAIETTSNYVHTAIVLAAGMGTRLPLDVYISENSPAEKPKGFLQIGDETLIERSLRLLSERGVKRIIIVAGHLSHYYKKLSSRRTDVEVVDNAS